MVTAEYVYHIGVSNHHDRVFWAFSFDQSTRAIFWEIDELCGDPLGTNFFGSQMFMQYSMYVPLILQILSNSPTGDSVDFSF